jgi:hypothetical protein
VRLCEAIVFKGVVQGDFGTRDASEPLPTIECGARASWLDSELDDRCRRPKTVIQGPKSKRPTPLPLPMPSPTPLPVPTPTSKNLGIETLCRESQPFKARAVLLFGKSSLSAGRPNRQFVSLPFSAAPRSRCIGQVPEALFDSTQP